MPYLNTYIELLQIEFSGIDWDPGKSRKKDWKTYSEGNLQKVKLTVRLGERHLPVGKALLQKQVSTSVKLMALMFVIDFT